MFVLFIRCRHKILICFICLICMNLHYCKLRKRSNKVKEVRWKDYGHVFILAPSSEFVSSSIPLWQILTAYAQPFRGARDLAFCLKVPLGSLLVWASSGGSGETAWMRRLAWTFAARIGDKYQIRLTRPILQGIILRLFRNIYVL